MTPILSLLLALAVSALVILAPTWKAKHGVPTVYAQTGCGAATPTAGSVNQTSSAACGFSLAIPAIGGRGTKSREFSRRVKVEIGNSTWR